MRLFGLIALFMACCFASAAEVVIPRLSPLPIHIKKEKVDLSGKWLFNVAPENHFWEKGKQRQNWSTIEVPGEWVMQGFEVKKGKAAGYSRTFSIPSSWKGKRVKLRCNGIYSESQIYINGKRAASHMGGFTAFETDVTNELTIGQENRIDVSVLSLPPLRLSFLLIAC